MVSLSFGLFAVAALCVSVEGLTFDETIEMVNRANLGWTAGRNFHPDTSEKFLRGLCGTLRSNSSRPRKTFSGMVDIPDEFDARKQWPNCPSISSILDQGSCGSCWAFGSASAFSDRLCIATNANFTLPLSEEDLIACNGIGGCSDGAYIETAWDSIADVGLVTGGGYKSNVGCLTYEIPGCEHNVTGRLPPCGNFLPTPSCKKECNNPSYTTSFVEDKHKADKLTIKQYASVEAIQEDVLKHGPISASFYVYEDFVHYKSGVYVKHPKAGFIAPHAVRVIGWGVENGTPYWLAANSWNADWGDKGTFKIRRGNDECRIDTGMVAGLPLLK